MDAIRNNIARCVALYRANFTCALAIVWPDGHIEEFEGRVDGELVFPPRGDKCFGYDPIFKPDELDKTFGEMMSAEKHARPLASRPRLSGPGEGVSGVRVAHIDCGIAFQDRAFVV